VLDERPATGDGGRRRPHPAGAHDEDAHGGAR
jgi:hypothetical protein